MTFDDWYAANIARDLPADIPKFAREAARAQMARCWNAALEAVLKTLVCADVSKNTIDTLRAK
jgi:hypothetical protein